MKALSKATKRAMKSRFFNNIVKERVRADKSDYKQTEELFAVALEFGRGYWELGRHHKSQGIEKQNFEQFFVFNKLNELDFAKKGVSADLRKEMTKEFARSVVYPAYESGYEGRAF